MGLCGSRMIGSGGTPLGFLLFPDVFLVLTLYGCDNVMLPFFTKIF